MKIKCRFYKSFFSRNTFSINLYRALDPISNPAKEKVTYFTAKGSNLPHTKDVSFILDGEWVSSTNSGRKGYIFDVSSFEDVIPQESVGIIKYLQTLDGVGRVTASRLYNAFGDDIFDILDNDIDRILEVKGIRKSTYKKIKSCWIQKSSGKELFAYLYKFKVPANVIMQIFETYEEFALDMIKKEPYSFVEFHGFGFFTADAIAKDISAANGEDASTYLNRPSRIKAGILEVIKEFEVGGPLIRNYSVKYRIPLCTGNTCIKWADLYSLSCELLKLNMDGAELSRIIQSMAGKEIFIADDNFFFRKNLFYMEKGIAKKVVNLLKQNDHFSLQISKTQLNKILSSPSAKKEIAVTLSEDQQDAVRAALNNRISIITGGPGTGKTAIQKAILFAMNEIVPDSEAILISPTGRAAHKMSEATGQHALTVHSALGLYAGERVYEDDIIKLTQDLIIVDEASMIDTELAFYLFSAVGRNSRIVIVGDVQQLPSVGPGCVLHELIESGKIPTTTLSTVYRQNTGSSININAQKIVSGSTHIIEDEDFQIIEVDGTDNIANKVMSLYKDQVSQNMDITVLSPYRIKTRTGVNMLNCQLQKIVFPNEKPVFDMFIPGDRIMFTKNANGLTNGECGTITNISMVDNEPVIECEFSGQKVTLDDESIKDLELAYASTIHKAQGDEREIVIIVMDPIHKIMHKRNLIYTAITRAKSKCIIVGSRKSFNHAILSEETNLRLSCLSTFIQQESTISENQFSKRVGSNEEQLKFEFN